MTTTPALPVPINPGGPLATLDPATAVLIGGTWQAGDRGRFVVSDPSTGEPLADVADGSPAQAVQAVDAAAAAARTWQARSPRLRADVLRRVFELMREHAGDLTALICAENGKSVADARAEVSYAADFFRWFSEEAVRSGGAYGPAPAGGARTIVTSRPMGIAALVTPWNFPAAMITRKVAPALAAGCTVVLKPAAETPLTAIAIARLMEVAGVPAGVVNVVPTSDAPGVVTSWLGDGRVRKLSFTGSTATGRILLRQAADRVIATSMELGGNAPFVVMPDADLDAAATGAMIAKFRGGGQACTAADRFYVHESVAPEFTALLAARIARLQVGPGADPDTDVGPLISAAAVAATRDLVDDALTRGARIAAQAQLSPSLTGSFFPPTLLVDVPPDAPVMQTETFAPVAAVATWRDTRQVLEWVNASESGLAGYVYSGDASRAMHLAEQMEVGMVAVNRGMVSDPSAPFGGMKQSGLGREGAREGLEAYQEIQYMSVDWPDAR